MAADRPRRRRSDRWPIILAIALAVLIVGAILGSWLILHQPTLQPVPISSVSQG